MSGVLMEGHSYNSVTKERAAKARVKLETYYHNLVVMHNERDNRYCVLPRLPCV